MPVGSGRFFASLRRIGFASEKCRPCCGRAFCGRCGGFLAVMLSIICFADKKWRGSRKVYKIKGRTKCNEYEKFDTCSRKIAHCLSSSFLYNLFRNLIHVIILFLSLYLFLILFFIPGVCLWNKVTLNGLTAKRLWLYYSRRRSQRRLRPYYPTRKNRYQKTLRRPARLLRYLWWSRKIRRW